MGFSRQLTSEEILEQVSRFALELSKQERDGVDDINNVRDASGGRNRNSRKPDSVRQRRRQEQQEKRRRGRKKRLSNIVFMGMGEPLANYKNVVEAVHRIQDEIGIGARKITISTVGLVPNIRKMMKDLPQVRLAVSLHCANDEERDALLPANARNGGLSTLMSTVKDYIDTTNRRITFEWALIEGQNDTPEIAHELGNLITSPKYDIRRDMVHVNVIPLNPTGGYEARPSGKQRVYTFASILEDKYGVACTPRVRRGIDINAGCGQLKAEVEKRNRIKQGAANSSSSTSAKKDQPEFADFLPKDAVSTTTVGAPSAPMIGVYADEEEDAEVGQEDMMAEDFLITDESIDFDQDDDWEDSLYTSMEEKDEAQRLMSLVQNTVITDANAVIRSNDEYRKKEQ